MSGVDVSFIIVSYNAPEMLRTCLRSIETYIPLKKEIIVVDNHSLEGNPNIVRTEFPDVILIENSENLGYSRAINQGLERTAGDYCAVLNADIEFTYDCVSPILSYIRSNPQIGAAGCSLTFPDGSPQRSYFTFPSLIGRVAYFTKLNKLINAAKRTQHFSVSGDIIDVEVVCGAFFIVKRDIFQAAGGFDTDYFLYQEEADFCYRLYKSGYRNVVLLSEKVVHHGWNEETPDNPIVFYHRNRSLLTYFIKNRSLIVSMIFWKINFIGILLQTAFIFCMFWQTNRKRRLKAYTSVLKYHMLFLPVLFFTKKHRIDSRF